MLPLIHLNGTSAQAIYDQQKKVSCACRALLRALEEAAPNARDYYPKGDDAYRTAAAEHRAKVEQVDALIKACQEQMDNAVDNGRVLASDGRVI
jgi:hypothetical protein